MTGGSGKFIAVAVLGVVAALWTWTAPGNPKLYPARADDPGVVVYLLDNGFHTDLVVPRAALSADGGALTKALDEVGPGDWILIGWGDAKFYVDQSPITSRLADGFRAFFKPGNASVVMLDPEPVDPSQEFAAESRRAIHLSSAGFAAMRAHIQASLDVRSGGPRLASARPGDDARFFASHEDFWIGHLCNHWTAKVLNAAGLQVRPLRSVTSAEVMSSVDRDNGSALQPASAPVR